jgi:putative spermidine/putrescine transport system substrate-binding protein
MKKWAVVTICVVLLIGIALLFAYLYLTRPKPSLIVATWPESYGHAQMTAQLVPFGAKSGTNVLAAIYDGGTTELAQQVASKQFKWDVMDLELPDAVAACSSGLLEPIDAANLPAAPNGTPAAEDFVPGAIGPCWVASVVYSQIIAVAPVSFGDRRPATLGDFFDAKKFPGKRALNRNSAKYNVEMALIADGVAPKDVYAVLSTPQGVARALAKLDSIRSDIVWYTSVDEAKRMLQDGRAAMGSLPNWAVFDVNNASPATATDLAIIWDRQLYEMEAFGIPKGNPKHDKAMDFVRFATQAQNLGQMASWIPYGPARRSAVAYAGENPDLKIAMRPYLPTAHFETAFAVDDGWWRLHGADVNLLWQAWQSKTP